VALQRDEREGDDAAATAGVAGSPVATAGVPGVAATPDATPSKYGKPIGGAR